MSAFKKLSELKDSLPIENKPVKRKIVGNVRENLIVSDHAVERFLQRKLNDTKTGITDFKKYITDKVHELGVVGYYSQKYQQDYVALEHTGLFIKKGQVLTTFIAPEKMNMQLKEIYINLLKKGRKDVH